MERVFLVVWLHFMADFALQSDKVATNKSNNLIYLGYHCLIYSAIFLIMGWEIAFFNGVAHFVVDFITSKLTSYYWSIDNRHAFFVTIGFDQAIHMSFLIASLIYL